MLKAVIFDLDGVLIDSEPLQCKASMRAALHFGVDIPEDYFYLYVGTSDKYQYQAICADFHIQIPFDDWRQEMRKQEQLVAAEDGYPVTPYIVDLIRTLHQEGLKLAVVASSPTERIDTILSAIGIADLIDCRISGVDVEHYKPAPDIYMQAATAVQENAGDCLAIDDSKNGVHAALAAGMVTLGYLNPHSGAQNLSEVSYAIEGFEEVDLTFLNMIYMRAHNEPLVIAATSRLIIRELTVDDIADMYQIYRNQAVQEYVDDIAEYYSLEVEKHKAYIKNVYCFYGYGYWGVFSQENGKLIGRCGIQNNTIDGSTEIELGYLLDEAHWGFGYANECCKCVLEYAFYRLSIPRIVAVIDKHNVRSIHVAERLGMHLEKEIIHHDRNCYLYVITHNTEVKYY